MDRSTPTRIDEQHRSHPSGFSVLRHDRQGEIVLQRSSAAHADRRAPVEQSMPPTKTANEAGATEAIANAFAVFLDEIDRLGRGSLTVVDQDGTRRRFVLAGEARDETPAAEAPAMHPRVAEAVARASARGSTRASAILSGDDMLTSAALGERLGLSRQAIDNRRKAGRLLALDAEKRGQRYPAWQIGPDGRVIPGLEKILAVLPGPWEAYRLLAGPAPDGSDRPAWAMLADGMVAPVLDEARARAAGDFT